VSVHAIRFMCNNITFVKAIEARSCESQDGVSLSIVILVFPSLVIHSSRDGRPNDAPLVAHISLLFPV
jgi:hypothetical protein